MTVAPLAELDHIGIHWRLWITRQPSYPPCCNLQIFTALDKASKELGFEHNDLNTANIMEHRPDEESLAPYIPEGFKPDEERGPAAIKLPGPSTNGVLRCWGVASVAEFLQPK